MSTKTTKKPMDHLKPKTAQDRRNEEALEMLVDILEPATEIFTDPEIVAAWEDENKTLMSVVVLAVKRYKTNIIRILAAYDGIPYSKADYSAKDIIVKVMEIVQDPEIMSFFGGFLRQATPNVSGSATGTTTATEAE